MNREQIKIAILAALEQSEALTSEALREAVGDAPQSEFINCREFLQGEGLIRSRFDDFKERTVWMRCPGHAPALRASCREAMVAAPSRSWTTKMVADALAQILPEKPPLDEVADALRWNESRGLVEQTFNTDLDRSEWRLTRAGQARQQPH